MCLIIYKLIICLIGTYAPFFPPFNSQNINVSNYILLHNYMVFIKKSFSHVILSMKTFSDVVISMVTKYDVTQKHGIYLII
jgi:hypothetical protein